METRTEEIYLDSINEPEHAMRTDIDRDAVFELAADIKKNGLINPITVRPKHLYDVTGVCDTSKYSDECEKIGHYRYEVVAGHRRLLAHRFGGMSKIKCIIRELTDDEAFAIMTSENLARQDVDPVDEAVHVGRLVKMYAGDLNKVCEVTNRSRAWVDDRIAIASMPEYLKLPLKNSKIKLGVALAINQITDETDREAVTGMALTQGASVMMAQYWLAQWNAGLFGHALGTSAPDSEVPEGQRRVPMFRCAIDGKEYPCTDFTSILVYRDNVPAIDALREQLKILADENTLEPVGEQVES